MYGVVMCGWASNSKYALFGTVRALAQIISYEVMMVMLYLVPFFLARRLEFGDVLSAQRGGCNGFVLILVFLW